VLKHGTTALISLPTWDILISSNAGGNEEIYGMALDSGTTVNLTRSLGGDGGAAWTHDGKILFSSDRGGSEDVYIMNADGSGQTRLTISPATDCDAQMRGDTDEISFRSNRSGSFQIYVMRVDGTDVRQITRDIEGGAWVKRVFGPRNVREHAWSPDGKTLAFVTRHRKELTLNLLDTVTEEARTITGSMGWISDLAWSPDSSYLLFRAANEDDQPLAPVRGVGVFVFEAAMRRVRRITDSLNDVLSARWLSSGQTIVFSASTESDYHIWIVDTSGAILRKFEAPYETCNLHVSPHGDKLLFEAYTDEYASADVCIVDIDGSNLRWLTSDPGTDIPQGWVPAIWKTDK